MIDPFRKDSNVDAALAVQELPLRPRICTV
jgi:hypothetical protein